MLLKDRSRSYQWAQIERKLFDKNNIGFVRPIDPKGVLFSLDPSPFLPTQRRIFYVCQQIPPPVRGDLVRVTVHSEKEELNRDYVDVIKYISKWERVDPSTIVTKKKILEPYELMDFFKAPFIGDETYVQKASSCAVLSYLAAPATANNIGGINTAIIGKSKFWKPYKTMMDVIPVELTKPTSDYYYEISKEEKKIPLHENKEVSLTFHNPEFIPMHIPLVMNSDPDFTSKKFLQPKTKDNEHLIPFVISYLLDSILFKPELPEGQDKLLTDSTYEIRNDIASAGYSPCNLDIGSILPKMSMAFGRFNSEMIVKTDYIKSSVELWLDMFYDAKKHYSTPFHLEELFKLGDVERKLYVHLVDVCGIEHRVPEKEIVPSLNSIRMTREQYDESMETLNRFGLVIRYPNNILKILDTVKPRHRS